MRGCQRSWCGDTAGPAISCQQTEWGTGASGMAPLVARSLCPLAMWPQVSLRSDLSTSDLASAPVAPFIPMNMISFQQMRPFESGGPAHNQPRKVKVAPNSVWMHFVPCKMYQSKNVRLVV